MAGVGEVRLIGGLWKRSRLPVPIRPGLRPTPDRVRETLFNWLGQDLSDWRVLDAFAGSGALGFESASRGAATVQLLESDPSICALLAQSQARLGAAQVLVQCADALAWMAQAAPADWDLVLLDPPFDAPLFEPAMTLAPTLLKPGGWLYLEAPAQWSAEPTGLKLHRHLRAGAVHAHLWRKTETQA